MVEVGKQNLMVCSTLWHGARCVSSSLILTAMHLRLEHRSNLLLNGCSLSRVYLLKLKFDSLNVTFFEPLVLSFCPTLSPCAHSLRLPAHASGYFGFKATRVCPRYAICPNFDHIFNIGAYRNLSRIQPLGVVLGFGGSAFVRTVKCSFVTAVWPSVWICVSFTEKSSLQTWPACDLLGQCRTVA